MNKVVEMLIYKKIKLLNIYSELVVLVNRLQSKHNVINVHYLILTGTHQVTNILMAIEL